MNLITIITLVLCRLYALNWGVVGLTQMVAVLVPGPPFAGLSVAPPLAYLGGGVVCWCLAPFIARFVTGKIAAPIPEIYFPTREHLYATAFVGLGAYFVLSSFGRAFNWVHYFIVSRHHDHGFSKNESPSYYDLTELALTLAAGLTLFVLGGRLAEKMNQANKRDEEEAAPAP